MIRDYLRTTAALEETPACDPYLWLEDRHSSATGAWLASQADTMCRYFSTIGPSAALRERVIQYLGMDAIHQPARVGDLYFYLRRSPGQEQPSICVNGRNPKVGTRAGGSRQAGESFRVCTDIHGLRKRRSACLQAPKRR